MLTKGDSIIVLYVHPTLSRSIIIDGGLLAVAEETGVGALHLFWAVAQAPLGVPSARDR